MTNPHLLKPTDIYPGCAQPTVTVYFLGSNRLPHCDPNSETCPEIENFYAGETLRFQISSVYGFIGKPRLRFKIGIATRFANINLSNSSLSGTPGGAILEFEYVVQGSDFGNWSGSTIYESTANFGFDVNEENNVWLTEPGSVCFFDGFDNSIISWQPGSIMSNVTFNSENELDNTNSNNARLLIKRSDEPNKVPQPSDLLAGELAINTNDEKIYFKNKENVVVSIPSLDINLEGISDNNLLIYNSAAENWEPSTNLTYDGSTLRLIANGNLANFRINQFYEDMDEPSRLIFRRARGTQTSPSVAAAGDGIYAIRGESLDYNQVVSILGGIRMEIVDPASSTSLYPSTRIFLRTNAGGNTLENSYNNLYLEPDGTLINEGEIRAAKFHQTTEQDNTISGSLSVNNGLNAPTPVYTHPTSYYSGVVNITISYGIDKQIQVFPSIPSTVTRINFIEGADWPSVNSVDVILELEFTSPSPVDVIWNIVDDWYFPAPSFVAGKYLILLRSVNGIIQGHYLSQKTN